MISHTLRGRTILVSVSHFLWIWWGQTIESLQYSITSVFIWSEQKGRELDKTELGPSKASNPQILAWWIIHPWLCQSTLCGLSGFSRKVLCLECGLLYYCNYQSNNPLNVNSGRGGHLSTLSALLGHFHSRSVGSRTVCL